MLNRKFARAANVSVVKKSKKKSRASGFQPFDQSQILNEVEESAGNFLGRVVKGGTEPEVEVNGWMFRDGRRRVFPVSFRKGEIATKPLNSDHTPSYFKRKLEDVAAPPPEKAPENYEVGEIVELRSCLMDEAQSEIFAWEARRLADSGQAASYLPMAEVPTCLVNRSDLDDPVKKQYWVVVAAPGEAEEITGVFNAMELMKELIGKEDPMIEGFIVRGKRKPGVKERVGISLLRTRKHDEEKMLPEQIIIDFLAKRGKVLAESVNPNNPWEIIPLYRLPLTKECGERVEGLAKRADFHVFQEANSFDLKFVHGNVVVKFTAAGPKVTHYNLSRAKPILMDTSLPPKAKETKVKTRYDNIMSFS